MLLCCSLQTSLLHAILKELPISSGTVMVGGTISYASQEPWLFTGSVQQNILFGQPMDRSRYRQVVRVCALEQDFRLLPHGDRTIVGERGVTLSGGQRARINLARCGYVCWSLFLQKQFWVSSQVLMVLIWVKFSILYKNISRSYQTELITKYILEFLIFILPFKVVHVYARGPAVLPLLKVLLELASWNCLWRVSSCSWIWAKSRKDTLVALIWVTQTRRNYKGPYQASKGGGVPQTCF
jgi:hypothetical protein